MPENATQRLLFEETRQKQYYRVMAGEASKYARQCFDDGFIGVNFGFNQDLNAQLTENWRDFNRKFRPIFLENHPGKSKVAAGLACGMTYTLAKALQVGDVILCPDGSRNYYVGEISGPYQYVPGEILPHRRPVRWLATIIKKEEMSEPLRNSAGAIGALGSLEPHAREIESLIGGARAEIAPEYEPDVENPGSFAMEKHLEEFIVQNWSRTVFANNYEIFNDGEGNTGQQYNVGDGRIDILAISKDRNTLLVIELKKGRPSDVVVGQILRYMGFIQEELAENGQTVKGAIIALEDDKKLHQALRMVPEIEFFLYKISFKLVRGLNG